jgi:hypothetical protein
MMGMAPLNNRRQPEPTIELKFRGSDYDPSPLHVQRPEAKGHECHARRSLSIEQFEGNAFMPRSLPRVVLHREWEMTFASKSHAVARAPAFHSSGFASTAVHAGVRRAAGARRHLRGQDEFTA